MNVIGEGRCHRPEGRIDEPQSAQCQMGRINWLVELRPKEALRDHACIVKVLATILHQEVIQFVEFNLPLGGGIVVTCLFVFAFEVLKEVPPLFAASIEGGIANAGDAHIRDLVAVNKGRKVDQLGPFPAYFHHRQVVVKVVAELEKHSIVKVQAHIALQMDRSSQVVTTWKANRTTAST